MLRKYIADMNLRVIARRFNLHQVQLRLQQIRNLRFVRIAHHHPDTRQLGDLFRRALRIATRHQDARFRILAMHTPHRLPHIVVGIRRHGARIENHPIGAFMGLRTHHPARRQSGFNRRSISLRGTAAEVPDYEFLHFFPV